MFINLNLNVMVRRKYIPAIVIMFVLFFMIAFVTGLQNPLGVIVKFQFGLSNGGSQLGNFVNFMAYALMGLPAGYFLRKYGYKMSSLIATGIGFTGVGILYISGLAANFWIYLLGAFVAGFAMCMLNAVVNPMLNSIGGGGNRGNQLIQIGGAFNSLAATVIPFVVGALMGQHASHTIKDADPVFFAIMAIFLVSFVIIFFTKIPEPERDIAERPRLFPARGTASYLSFRHFKLGAVAVFLYVGVEISIANSANIYLIHDMGIHPLTAGVIVSAYWLCMFIGRAIGGYFASRDMLSFAAFGALALILMTIFTPSKIEFVFGRYGTDIPVNVLFLILCGLFTSVMWGSIFNLAVDGLGKYTEEASGFFMLMVCGGGVIPVLQGLLADWLGFLNSLWLIFACLAFILYYASAGYKNVNRNIQV